MALPKDGPGSFAFWVKEADRSKDWWQALAEKRGWDKNVQAYMGKTLDGTPSDDTVVVPKDYANVEQKKALLFFQVPEVTLTAKQPNLESAIPLFQAVLNAKLAHDEVNAGALMDELLFDVLCPAGIGASKIGYEAEQDGEVPMAQPAMDPMGQPIVDPLTGQPVQTQVMVPNIVRERYFWERIPVKQLLIPVDFHGSDFDKAPWLGFRFETDLAVASRTYGVDKELLKPTSSDDEARLKADLNHETSGGQKVCGYEIWYQASRYHEDVANGDIYYQIVWFDGMENPAVARPSPYQQIENGRVVGGMRGNPIHVLTLRYVSDQAVPPSDVSMSRDLVDEMSEGRTAMIRQRKRTTPITAYDPARVPKEAIDRVINGQTQEAIPVPGLNANESPVQEVRRAMFPRENFSFNDYVNADIQECWAMGSNQQGLQTRTKQTATEASIQQSATQTRMRREQTQVARWFIAGVQKLGSLIQMFADDPDYIEVIGQDGARTLQQWDKRTIQGRFAYSAKPDSTLQLDAAYDKKARMDEYQFFRKDPLVNPTYLLQRTARGIGADPAQFVVQPQPPKPPPPQPSFAFKGDDFNPAMPQFSIVVEILKQGGIVLPPEVLQTAQFAAGAQIQQQQAQAAAEAQPEPSTEHGGMQPEAEPLNKHQANETGMLPGGGLAPGVM